MDKIKLKSVLVVDWLDKFAGSERVISEICEVIDFKETYALVSVMSSKDLKKTLNTETPTIKTSSLQLAGKFFRYLFPLFPFFVKQLHVSEDADLVVSSSHAISKGVITPESAMSISYFQARNMKYIWEESHLYFSGGRKVFRFLIPFLRRYDKKSAQLPDYIISNSKFVQKWVEETYGRKSELIYPPVEVSSFTLGEHLGEYFVTVGRLEPYKRFDLIVDVFNQNGLPLKVIGDGSQRYFLESIANSNIEFLGFQEFTKINTELMNAKAFVYAGVEDFGIAPVEAQATGAPVICLNKAGTAETILDGVTGVLFEKQTVESLNEAINRFLETRNSFDYSLIRKHAFKYSSERFKEKFNSFVKEKLSTESSVQQ